MNSRFATVSEVIRERRTVKRFASPEQQIVYPSLQAEQNDLIVRESVAIAGWSPFHFDRQLDAVPEPWRVQIIWSEACRQLAKELPQIVPDWKPGNKLPLLLSACGAVVLVSWLPVTADEVSDDRRRTELNQEHLAATSAYIQNLLLLLTAGGMETYWASANLFDLPVVKERLQGDPRGKLAGAIFVGYDPQGDSTSERAFGGNRQKRTSAEHWKKEVTKLKG